MKTFVMIGGLAAGTLFLSGCLTTQPDIQVIESPRIVTLAIDARDYNETAKRIYDSLTASPRVKRGKVVSLGPVDVALDRDYQFDHRALQEKLQVIALRSGLLEFNYAVDALTGNSAATERYRIMELQWTKENTVDPELLRTIGNLAKVDYILFGRVSSQTAIKGNQVEVTHRYNWKLGDCESGLLIWADEMEITKSKAR